MTRAGLTLAVTLGGLTVGALVALSLEAQGPPTQPAQEIVVRNELTPFPQGWTDLEPPTRLDLNMAPILIEGRTPQERCDNYGGVYYPDVERCLGVDY